MCHDNEQWYKIWRRTYLLLQKSFEEFDEFSFHASTQKSQNFHFDWVPMSKEYKVLNNML